MNSSISGYSVLCSFYAADATNSTSDDGHFYNTISHKAATSPNDLLHISADKTVCRLQQNNTQYIFSAASDCTYALKGDLVILSAHNIKQKYAVRLIPDGPLLCARISAGNYT